MWGRDAVICAGSFSRHAVDRPSLWEYYNLYGAGSFLHHAVNMPSLAVKHTDNVSLCCTVPRSVWLCHAIRKWKSRFQQEIGETKRLSPKADNCRLLPKTGKFLAKSKPATRGRRATARLAAQQAPDVLMADTLFCQNFVFLQKIT